MATLKWPSISERRSPTECHDVRFATTHSPANAVGMRVLPINPRRRKVTVFRYHVRRVIEIPLFVRVFAHVHHRRALGWSGFFGSEFCICIFEAWPHRLLVMFLKHTHVYPPILSRGTS